MSLKRLLGFDTRKQDYAYGRDPSYGFTSAAKIPERWVPTTCGYCSVGCGAARHTRSSRPSIPAIPARSRRCMPTRPAPRSSG